MDFICNIFFPNEPLISWTFIDHLCHYFWVCATAKQHQTHPKAMTKMTKKCSTDQRFIRKRNTTYKIHTLVNYGNCKYFFKIMKKLLVTFQSRLANTARVVNFLSDFVLLALFLFIEWNFWPEIWVWNFCAEKEGRQHQIWYKLDHPDGA